MAGPARNIDHLTQVTIHLDRLTHNVGLLREVAGRRPLWPVIKANAYGHGAEIVARHLIGLGCETLCVSHLSEARSLAEAGVGAHFVLLSATLPEQADAIVAGGFEPVVSTPEMAMALSQAAQRANRKQPIQVKIDCGMGRTGIRPDEALVFLDRIHSYAGITVRGLIGHFFNADHEDKSTSKESIDRFLGVLNATAGRGIAVHHLANSAAIFDLPASHLDLVRPGIALYGLKPSATIANPRVEALRPVLEWTTRITFLKDVPAGTGLSYGHRYRTVGPARIATVAVGYGDGMNRGLSNRCDMLVHGIRCPQVGTITMDQCLIDVTALGEKAVLGDTAVLIGRQGGAEITADELAGTLDTIAYEIVTAISARVPRIAVAEATS